MEGQLLVTVSEAAKLLSVSERTVFALTKRGEIGSVRIGRAVRYWVDELRAWVRARNERQVAGGESESR